VSGPWYACPSEILSMFKHARVEQPFVRELKSFSELPPFGTDREALAHFRDEHALSAHCQDTCP
jgi:hypothetical protein